MFTQVLLLFFILPIVEERVYLYSTEDSSSLEFYDCIHHNNLIYCRRPLGPITLQRENKTLHCYQNGTFHSFTSLLEKNINVSIILNTWGSTIEKAEEYSHYIRQSTKSIDENENYLCECNHPQSFGKYCEYLLPVGTTFKETLDWEINMRKMDPGRMQMYGDILCYTTIICDSGLLCLDWRDICDGVQQCMFGYDEENCDKLEFNECESNEYRCMNGMCIPDEYFLDGEYDCTDMTDEMGRYNDSYCTFQPVSLECDDRMCLPNKYSCGDGQCIDNRLAFQVETPEISECKSLREQYHICETHSSYLQWTLPNGKCYSYRDFEEIDVLNRSRTEECIYFLKCVLSQGYEKNCPSEDDEFGRNQLKKYCLSPSVQYPIGAIIAPYIFHFYDITKKWLKILPDFIKINASIKCRGYMINHHLISSYRTNINLLNLEELLCMSSSNSFTVPDDGYDRFCYNDSQTFNKHPYNFIDICNYSKECISAYRIADSFRDCADNMDDEQEELVSTACFKIQRYRFRCSVEQPTCLPINVLGDTFRDCNNNHDEVLMGTNLLLSKLNCNSRSKEDCAIIRHYIEASWNYNTDNGSSKLDNGTSKPVYSTKKIPFRSYCDTLWNLKSKEDEDIAMCQKWWVCLDEQWQCRTRQCINTNWVLDGEWDCFDASDEEGIVFLNNTLLFHNSRALSHSVLEEKFRTLYGDQPFWNICDLQTEFPCFPVNYSNSLANNIRERPCISLEKIGNGYADCLGGLDERNTLEYCNTSDMLGYAFKCLSTGTCIDFLSVCLKRCPNITDDQFRCAGLIESENDINANDFMCWNGTIAKDGWCNHEHDCFYGEDEYYCNIPNPIIDSVVTGWYRHEKKYGSMNIQQKLNLPLFPVSMQRVTTAKTNSSTIQKAAIDTNSSNLTSSLIAYVCNRGVGIYMYNNSIACFCPQQYYGEKCQFHSDRVTLLLHVNLSQSNYTESTNPAIVLKMLVVFLFEDQILAINECHVRPAVEITTFKKEIIHFLYSRSNESLYKKRERYFNRSNIINEHPYSIRIEAFELNLTKTPKLIAVWQYPIYFDYLPSFRLAKILQLTKTENIINPCSSNPCTEHHECHQLLNQQLNYICLCPSNFKGNDCSTPDRTCSAGFCSPDALCKPNYRSLLKGNQLPYCICPLGRYGHRCELVHDQCKSNPCQNQGICLLSGKLNEYYCMCTHPYRGKQCQLSEAVSLYFGQSIENRAIVVQYFQIDFSSFDLNLVHQNVFIRLPGVLHYLHDTTRSPEIIVAKRYSDLQADIYIISLQTDANSINVTTQISEINRCVNVHMLFPTNEEASPFEYHHLCIKNHSLFCFFDDIYLCICDQNHSRVECFGYDHNLDRCSSCFANGQCLKGDRTRVNDFLCLCPRCHYGSLCQFSNGGLSFTLDSLIIQISRSLRIMYLVFALLIFVVGGVTNYASFITFKRANLRKSGVGIYLLAHSLISQYSLLLLIMKIILILGDLLMNDISCKIISHMLSVSIRCSFWLTSWIAIERVCYLLFPFATLLKKPRIATIIIFITLLIIAGMHVHELIFYIKDPSGQAACVVNFPLTVIKYDRITVLLHYLIPFCIQILSITVLIILAARSRSRTNNNSDTFIEYLKRQFNRQKELYITPTVIILSGLPQAILSFSFACIRLTTWQQHVLLIAYLLSYAPQLLGFVLFVLPSTDYMKEFRATNLAKTMIFRWILSNKKRPENKNKNITPRKN